MARSLRGGEGVKAGPLRKKIFFKTKNKIPMAIKLREGGVR